MNDQQKDQLHRVLVDSYNVHSCLTCEFFDEKTEVCLGCQQRPPAEVIVFGCPAWEGRTPF